jgi:hypothetical protein
VRESEVGGRTSQDPRDYLSPYLRRFGGISSGDVIAEGSGSGTLQQVQLGRGVAALLCRSLTSHRSHKQFC